MDTAYAPTTQEKETENYEFFLTASGHLPVKAGNMKFCWRVITGRRHPGLMLFQTKTLDSRYRSLVPDLPGVSTAGRIS